jgi:hypothetical protein
MESISLRPSVNTSRFYELLEPSFIQTAQVRPNHTAFSLLSSCRNVRINGLLSLFSAVPVECKLLRKTTDKSFSVPQKIVGFAFLVARVISTIETGYDYFPQP